MAARDVLKNFNAYVDGFGYAGQVAEYNPPDLAIQTDAHRAGGMDAPIDIDMGMERLEFSFGLNAYDLHALRQFGIVEGGQVPFTLRGALESYDSTVKPVVHQMRSKIIRIARGAWQPGQKPTLTITGNAHYYREEIDGELTHEIDVINMIRIVNGVDRLAEQRAAMGL